MKKIILYIFFYFLIISIFFLSINNSSNHSVSKKLDSEYNLLCVKNYYQFKINYQIKQNNSKIFHLPIDLYNIQSINQKLFINFLDEVLYLHHIFLN